MPPSLATAPERDSGLPEDQGRRFAVKMDTNRKSRDVRRVGSAAIKIPRLDGQNGGDVYRENIQTCGGMPTGYRQPGDRLPGEHRK